MAAPVVAAAGRSSSSSPPPPSPTSRRCRWALRPSHRPRIRGPRASSSLLARARRARASRRQRPHRPGAPPSPSPRARATGSARPAVAPRAVRRAQPASRAAPRRPTARGASCASSASDIVVGVEHLRQFLPSGGGHGTREAREQRPQRRGVELHALPLDARQQRRQRAQEQKLTARRLVDAKALHDEAEELARVGGLREPEQQELCVCAARQAAVRGRVGSKRSKLSVSISSPAGEQQAGQGRPGATGRRRARRKPRDERAHASSSCCSASMAERVGVFRKRLWAPRRAAGRRAPAARGAEPGRPRRSARWRTGRARGRRRAVGGLQGTAPAGRMTKG